MEIKVTRAGLMLDGKLMPLVSGTMHYWRVAREKWEPVLDLVKELGFGIVETYVPWSAHELERGKFDFGERDRIRDLAGFITMVAERGLKLIVRPGPHINAEITCFGYPERVLRRAECRSVSVDGDPVWMPTPPKMWPAPSYAAEAFYEEVGLWFDAVAAVIKPKLAGAGGPIIMLQVDNEFSNFFRTSPYDHDYHPDAIKLWETFYRQKHGENAPVPSPLREFAAQGKDDLPLYLDWVEYKEYYMQNALARLKKMWEERGITGVPFFHNYPTGHDLPPNNYTEIEKIVDIQGPDMYPTRKQYAAQKALCSFASGLSRLPYIPEFSSGGFFWTPPISVRDQAFTTPACFMHGIKAINFYMIVERERWYGSPITRDGRKRPAQWELLRDFHKWFARTHVNELEKQAGALLLSVRDYERLQLATTILDPAPPITPAIVPAAVHCSIDKLGFEGPIQLFSERQWFALFHGLSAAQVPFDCGNTSQPAEDLSRYRMVLCPTYEFMDRAAQEKLRQYAQAGGALVIGPRLPELDARMKPCNVLAGSIEGDGEKIAAGRAAVHKCGAGRIIVIAEHLPPATPRDRPEATTDLLLAIARAVDLPRPYPCDDPRLETVLHQGPAGAVLFAANPTSDDRTARFALPGGESLTDAQTDEKYHGPTAEIPLPAHTVKVLEIREA